MKIRPTFTVVLVSLIAAIAVAGCGSSSKSTTTTGSTSASASAGASTINISVDPNGQLKYIPSSITTTAGKHMLVFTNKTSLKHDVIIGKGVSPGGQVAGVKKIANSTESKTITLKPGTYTYYCNVPDHRQAGMQGTLIVK